jgi:hypothetical protein
VLAKSTGAVWLEPDDLWTMLRAAGIEFAASELAPPAEAAATAERLGYPLVAKAVAPGLLHKSDVGAVILDLDSAAAVASAVETLGSRLGTWGFASNASSSSARLGPESRRWSVSRPTPRSVRCSCAVSAACWWRCCGTSATA